MPIEDFLYRHLTVTVGALMVAAQWAVARQLLTGWQYKAATTGISWLALYLAVAHQFTFWLLVPMALSTALTVHVWRIRPRLPRLDGSHEAL